MNTSVPFGSTGYGEVKPVKFGGFGAEMDAYIHEAAQMFSSGFVSAIYGKQRFTSKTRYNMDANGGLSMTPQQFIVYQQNRFKQYYVDANQPSIYKGV